MDRLSGHVPLCILRQKRYHPTSATLLTPSLLTSYISSLLPTRLSSSHQKRGGKNKEAAGTAASLFSKCDALNKLRRDDEVRDLPHRAPRGPMQSVQEHQASDQEPEAWYLQSQSNQ